MAKFNNDRLKNRVATYMADDELKWFCCNYENRILESILIKYNYSSEYFADPTNISGFDQKIPGYKGVQTLEELTDTLINAYISFGTADEGLEIEFNSRKNEIRKAFITIKGNSQETINFDECEDFEEDDFDDDEDSWDDDYDFWTDGFDFELNNGVYHASYRQCKDGW